MQGSWCSAPELRPLSILCFPAKSPILSQFQNLDNLIAKVILDHSRELRNLVYTANPVQNRARWCVSKPFGLAFQKPHGVIPTHLGRLLWVADD
ncbi:MAG: hypothetical protein EORIYHIE_000568 [Candidatus Fervidibacter sp.]|jgi:hypothetical protein